MISAGIYLCNSITALLNWLTELLLECLHLFLLPFQIAGEKSNSIIFIISLPHMIESGLFSSGIFLDVDLCVVLVRYERKEMIMNLPQFLKTQTVRSTATCLFIS